MTQVGTFVLVFDIPSESDVDVLDVLVTIDVGVLSGDTLKRMWVDFTLTPVELLVEGP